MSQQYSEPVEVTAWFRALSRLEQREYLELDGKRAEARELMHSLSAALIRMRRMGGMRAARKIETLAIPLRGSRRG